LILGPSTKDQVSLLTPRTQVNPVFPCVAGRGNMPTFAYAHEAEFSGYRTGGQDVAARCHFPR